jgi:seryl-tRNA synthetase
VIDIRRLRQDPDGVRAALARRGDASLDQALVELLKLDEQRRTDLVTIEELKARRNRESDEVARLKKAKQPADELLATLKASGEAVKKLEVRLKEIDDELERVLLLVPNLPLPEVPAGDASKNEVVRTWGTKASFPWEPRPHWDLGAALGILDLPRGAKIAGSGFPLFTGMGSRLIRALANFMLDLHTQQHGYTEVSPPYLVNRTTLTGTGQLPKFEEDMYAFGTDDLFLLPTAEVPVTNIHRDEILDGAELPKLYTACTPCFRREAGSAGKDTRGILRVHQFDKVELVQLVRPEESMAALETITAQAEKVLQLLGLHYRVLALAAGDTGFASARTYDLEVWAPGVGQWLEVSSASCFTDFQARRAGIRFRPEPGAKPEFVHTLNASGLAFPRTLIAILETGQQGDGSVVLPSALVPYAGTERLRPRA